VFRLLSIPDLLLAEVIEHARATAPLECCGLLAGHITEGVGVVTARYPIENDAARSTEYSTNARQLLFAFRSMREHGTELLAIYHSHPASHPIPSRRDVENNTYGESAVHLIVGLADPEPEVRAWWLTEKGYRAAEFAAVSTDRSEPSGSA
jgi:proteasome lid subunit RPN8/RPN11